ncbi:MAG TPA: pyridoxal phosphate-dependent aminotransferase [Acetobacteraceae bacterium]|nr:pyridoxal phosphate-dependent aminotransferase [Acetobacteraceae bacterium]
MSDINRLPGSRIVAIARLAFADPDVDFLCFGESDQPSPTVARDAVLAAIDSGVTRYVDVRGLPALREALATYLSRLHARPVAEERIQITASGMAALNLALAATVRAGDRVIVHTPAWPNGANAARLRGATIATLPLTPLADGRFQLDLDRLASLLPGARAFLLNSPNNPTGWTATSDELAAILALCRRHGAWLISDEVYSRLTYDGGMAAPSLLDLATPEDRVIVCNSFSKSWVMTGWRLGWMVLPASTRESVAEIVEVTHSSVAPFIQHAGIAALADQATPETFRSFCAQGRKMVDEALTGLNGIRYCAPDAAFYAFIGIDGLAESMQLAERLVVEHKVATAPGSAFGEGGEGHLRICFAQSPTRLSRALDRLRAGLRAAAK